MEHTAGHRRAHRIKRPQRAGLAPGHRPDATGIPVATVAIGEAGAKNAAYVAAQIIGLSRPEVAERCQALLDSSVAGAQGA